MDVEGKEKNRKELNRQQDELQYVQRDSSIYTAPDLLPYHHTQFVSDSFSSVTPKLPPTITIDDYAPPPTITSHR